MSAIEKQAIDGVNETVQTIRAAQKKHDDQEHFVSLVSFNSDEVKTIYDKVEAERVEGLTDKQYCPSCCTPLYDAMGNSLSMLRKSVAEDDMVLVTIITDGYENASKEYNQPAIKKLVDELKSKGWVFTYIGANQDVEKVAATISVTNTLNFCTTAEGTDAMFAHERSSRSRFFDKLSFCKSKEDRDCLAEDDYFDEK
jgi:hypothetical protein